MGIGIPVEMFTVMFVLGRSLGWITHWLEMVSSGQMRIGRPRQLYQGVKEREVPKTDQGRDALPSADGPTRKVSTQFGSRASVRMASSADLKPPPDGYSRSISSNALMK